MATGLGTFQIDNVTCSLMICFDEFFPEVARLRACPPRPSSLRNLAALHMLCDLCSAVSAATLAGSRLLFYLSWEADIKDEYRNKPARAQVVARAQENMICAPPSPAPGRPRGH